MSKTDQYRELMEAYALGALDQQERAAVEAHLAAGCTECSKALDEAGWLVSQLAYLAPQAQPPDILRSRLMQTVHSEARAARSSPAVPYWMWGAVAAIVLFTLFQSWETSELQKQIAGAAQEAKAGSAKRQELEEEMALAKREAVILTDPRSVKIPLPPSNKDLPQLAAMWHAKLGIVVAGQRIPAPQGNRTLQLWLIPRSAGSKPIPSLVLRPDAEGNFMLLVADPPESMEATKALAITEEPAGGSQAPTTTPIWVGAIS